MSPENPLDLFIVGAGLSGVDLAHHVNENFPDWNWEIVDSNKKVGGTWVTFTYPGIRSDSDMATFSFPFKRWPHKGSLGSGENIQKYVEDVAREEGVFDRLTLSTWVEQANFDSKKGLWEVTMHTREDGQDIPEGHTDAPTAERTIWTKRLHFSSGYYKHHRGFTAGIPGADTFEGTLIHPQRWPENLDLAGKKVVIIGSGATAITLLPALHDGGADVTMLQRTPTYVAPLLNRDNFTAVTTKIMPEKQALSAARAMHIVRDMAQYWMCQIFPWPARGYFMALNRAYIPFREIFKNFNPPYGPWDQRVCKSPDGDFFKAMQGGARVVTAKIKEITPDGISLVDAPSLPADIIITATGLDIQVFGGARLFVDGEEKTVPDAVAYRGMMVDGLPNFSFTVGYLNQSWTLRADLVSRYMCRLWSMMDEDGYTQATPRFPAGLEADIPLMNMDSGYLVRARKDLPTQAGVDPWMFAQDYIREYRAWGHPGADLRADLVFS